MYIKALLEVDEEQLKEFDSDIPTEFVWLEQSGIFLLDYRETEI